MKYERVLLQILASNPRSKKMKSQTFPVAGYSVASLLAISFCIPFTLRVLIHRESGGWTNWLQAFYHVHLELYLGNGCLGSSSVLIPIPVHISLSPAENQTVQLVEMLIKQKHKIQLFSNVKKYLELLLTSSKMNFLKYYAQRFLFKFINDHWSTSSTQFLVPKLAIRIYNIARTPR